MQHFFAVRLLHSTLQQQKTPVMPGHAGLLTLYKLAVIKHDIKCCWLPKSGYKCTMIWDAACDCHTHTRPFNVPYLVGTGSEWKVKCAACLFCVFSLNEQLAESLRSEIPAVLLCSPPHTSLTQALKAALLNHKRAAIADRVLPSRKGNSDVTQECAADWLKMWAALKATPVIGVVDSFPLKEIKDLLHFILLLCIYFIYLYKYPSGWVTALCWAGSRWIPGVQGARGALIQTPRDKLLPGTARDIARAHFTFLASINSFFFIHLNSECISW